MLLGEGRQSLPHPGHKSRLTVAWKKENENTLCISIVAGNLLDPDHKKSPTTEGREGSLKDVRCSDTDLPKNGPGSRQQWIVPPSTIRLATT